MSRHRKVKAMDYDEEYNDYYGAFEDEDEFDMDEDNFESKYLNTGIDLNIGKSSNSNTKNEQSETIQQANDATTKIIPADIAVHLSQAFDDIETSPITDSASALSESSQARNKSLTRESEMNSSTPERSLARDLTNSITPDLTKIAIEHLDKQQWQLPLIEMDQRFRDKTYYKHYSDYYISSLRSKLGHFLADKQMIQNPMRYHIKKELDSYQKYSKMFDLLVEYYQSLGAGFFSFATPSPDEEIVIGCRLGTKANKKQPEPRERAIAKVEQKTARFEYSGTKSKQAQRQADTKPANNAKSKEVKKDDAQIRMGPTGNLTIQENHTVQQLEVIVQSNKEKMKKSETKTLATSSSGINMPTAKKASANRPITATSTSTSSEIAAPASASTAKAAKPSLISQKPPKQLSTLAEKRKVLKQKIKRNLEPSAQDMEAFRLGAAKVAQEYEHIMRGSRARLNLIVVGHVDAGKSTLVGHLLYKLGQINNKQMHRYEVDSRRSGKSSFKFAWAMDETSEERARGVTIDIALTKFETAHRDVVLLDAPGHVDFIPAVISGAAQADAALLVIDATRGEFETGFTSGGQTREHTFLVRSLGVKSLVVVINKMDSVGWNAHRFNDIVEQLRPFLKQVGLDLNEDVQFVAVSGLTGENLTERRHDKLLKQSSHPQLEQSSSQQLDKCLSLIEAIDRMKLPERMVDKPTRLCVTDIFKGMSSGVHLAGKLVSGKLQPKQKLVLLPPAEVCELKSVEARDGLADGASNRSSAYAGDIVTLTCTGIDMSKYYRGCVLCDPTIPCHVTNRFQARVIMFQDARTILIKGSPIELHINGTYESGQVRKLISLLNKNSGELIQSRPRCVTQNSSAILQLKLERVVCCELYENNKDLGRFMMRSCGKTIAAGLITKIKSAKVRKSGHSKMKSKS